MENEVQNKSNKRNKQQLIIGVLTAFSAVASFGLVYQQFQQQGLRSELEHADAVMASQNYKSPQTKHIYGIKLQGEITNNKMERMNGEIRDREKVTRGLERKDTPILKGLPLYHNYFREHEGLNEKTPAEIAGIKIEGQNKWITVIQNSCKSSN